MLKIRREQDERLRLQALVEFENRGVRHLRQQLRQPTAPFRDDELRQRIRACVLRAQQYGLTTEQQVMVFVDASYLVSEDFDSNPESDWAARILSSDQLEAVDKANLLIAVAFSVHNDKQSATKKNSLAD